MTQEFDGQSRNSARLAAVQALYQMELADKKSKLVVHEFNEHWFKTSDGPGNTDSEYFELIVLGVVAEQAAIDKAVSEKLSEKWKLDRLDTTLRAIMRCAAYEILRCFDVPGTVIIDQYVSMAHDFYEGGEPKFVNAALDKLAREYRTAEFGLVHVVDE
jgi:N utilization substance protein B